MALLLDNGSVCRFWFDLLQHFQPKKPVIFRHKGDKIFNLMFSTCCTPSTQIQDSVSLRPSQTLHDYWLVFNHTHQRDKACKKRSLSGDLWSRGKCHVNVETGNKVEQIQGGSVHRGLSCISACFERTEKWSICLEITLAVSKGLRLQMKLYNCD